MDVRYLLIPLAVTVGLFFAAQDPAWAQGKKSGFDRESGQGAKSKENTNANPNNQGQTTIEGPHGQIKQGNTDCNNCTQDLPGRNR
jgi:hypothetical protein